MEANPDETKNMRYKLISLNKDQTQVSTLSGLESPITLESNESRLLVPQTIPAGVDGTLGYTLILNDSSFANIQEVGSVPMGAGSHAASLIGSTDLNTSITAVAKSFKIITKPRLTTGDTVITIIGNESGAVYTIDLNVLALALSPEGEVNTGAPAM